MHVLVGDSVEARFTSHVTLVERAIPALIPLISSAAGRTNTGSVWCQLMCTSTKNNWQKAYHYRVGHNHTINCCGDF